MSKKDTQEQVQDAPQHQTLTDQPDKGKKTRTRVYLLPRLGRSIEAESPHHAIELADQQKGNG